ncbi:beta-ketoacyl-ACP synthase [Candidatus Synechococcus calcipolaris G9]|uniref:Beta-ketoacyl-ACP synthase n=1 Tax=Candidatus Synechococcus calcipolaris G9 TaxID=1497997 RepID=A0ABT6EXH7_9SYNE|nr:beta-ketoacyl-ACP synthase [Candidatus Synechococcus calcipolaris]MDG2989946.1 beta-ketoacyl-ACP synthase [Candidatus Synechococcus calcipolaris G9]
MSPLDVVITGLGLSTALGWDAVTSWSAYHSGECGLRFQQPFPELPAQLLGRLNQRLSLGELLQVLVLESLRDGNLSPGLENTGVVVGSSRSHQCQWEAWLREALNGPQTSDLSDWLNYLPGTVSRDVACFAQSCGPVLNPTAACATGLWAIALGCLLLESGQCERVIAGAVEKPITPLTLAGFARMGVPAQTRVAPFDRQRQGLGLAEGGALLILESREMAEKRGAKIYGRVLGVGLSADADQLAAPSSNQGGAIAAVQKSLAQAGLQPHQISYIHAHGTGTILNDRSEAAWIQHLFGNGIPVTSHKGAIGHTLGASGAISAAFSCLSLRDQIIPPCVGCHDPEFDIDIVLTPRSTNVETILCCSYGFGGQNAAVIFSQ